MPKVFIQAPTDKVFEAMCDLTRHAKWAKHDIAIESGQEGPPAVGNIYTSSHKGGKPDRLTITDLTPNERFGFHVVMPNNWELQQEMTASPPRRRDSGHSIRQDYQNSGIDGPSEAIDCPRGAYG